MKNTEPNKLYKVRHSLAHLLAGAVLKLHPNAKVGVGPVIENGFFYDFLLKKPPTSEELLKIESEMRNLIAQNLPFQRQVLKSTEAKKIFKNLDQSFKVELINDIEKYGTTEYEEIESLKKKTKKTKRAVTVTIYKTGDFIDLCRGGHVKNTKEINPDAFKIERVAGAYWRGNEKNPMLTRIYGIAFETKKGLEEYLKQKEEAEKRDHRLLGQKLELFMFHPFSPGIPFYLPKGTIVRNELEKFVREVSYGDGYEEVRFPQLFSSELWRTSGHLEHFRENMFSLKIDEKDFALKPMNCPAHMLYFKSKMWSYRDLPLRIAEMTTLFRNEISGVLGGLTRVRAFAQDDTHIFLTGNQLANEVYELIVRSQKIYKTFNLEISTISLSTRPKKAMGLKKDWDKAEKALKWALEKSGVRYVINKGEGAFYGPKIDFGLKDASGRNWQLATIQLDMQMPKRFGLEYVDKNGSKKTPLVIHRAILGSLERFLALLIEHFAGAFPVWLSPVQTVIIPVGSAHEEYAHKVTEELRQKNIRVELWNQNETVNKRIRDAEMQKIPYILVVGDKEVKENTVAVRKRGKQGINSEVFRKFAERVLKEILEKSRFEN